MRLSDYAAGPRPAETIRHSLVSFALEPKVWPMMRSAASRMSSQTASGSLPATPIKVVLPVAHSFVSARLIFADELTRSFQLNLPLYAGSILSHMGATRKLLSGLLFK